MKEKKIKCENEENKVHMSRLKKSRIYKARGMCKTMIFGIQTSNNIGKEKTGKWKETILILPK